MTEKTMNLILPMAGHGQRFVAAGHDMEKPLIEVNGRALLEWALDPLKGMAVTVYPVLRDDQQLALKRVALFMQHFAPPVMLPGSTPGAACTVLAAAIGMPQDEPVAAMNCDQWFQCDLKGTVERALACGWDGFMLTFPGTGPAWSYAVTNGDDRAVAVIEKKQVSPYATVGFYWWRRAGDLVKSICAMIAADERTKGEFYLAPSYNFLTLAQKDVRIVPVDAFVGLGTPEQLKDAENTVHLVREP